MRAMARVGTRAGPHALEEAEEVQERRLGLTAPKSPPSPTRRSPPPKRIPAGRGSLGTRGEEDEEEEGQAHPGPRRPRGGLKETFQEGKEGDHGVEGAVQGHSRKEHRQAHALILGVCGPSGWPFPFPCPP